MLEKIKGILFSKEQETLQGKIFRAVGLTFSIVLLVTGSFFAYTNWKNGKENALKYYTEQAQVNSTGAKMRTYRAIGMVRTLAISIDNIFDNGAANRDTNIARILSNISLRLNKYNDITLYQAAYFSFDQKYLPGEVGEGRLFYLATLDNPKAVRTRKVGFDSSESDKCLQHSESVGKTTISIPHWSSYENGSASAYVVTIAAPIEYNGKIVGSAGVDIPLEQLQRIIKKTVVPEGASAYLISHDDQVVAHTNQELAGKKLGADTDPKLLETLQTIFTEKNNALSAYQVEAGDDMHFVVPVNTDQTYTTWALGLTIPNKVIYKQARTDTFIAFLVALIGLVVSLYLSRILAKKITTPINLINQSITKLAKGEVKRTPKLAINDQTEIGQISGSVNNLIDSLNSATHFALEIGKENFSEELKLQSENDDIGHALQEMKESLLRSKEQENKRKEEEKLNNWANEGLAKFSEILRSNHDNMKELSFQVVSNLVKYLEINQGGLFVQNDTEKHLLDMTSCFAYNRRKLMEKQIEVGEGLVGRCFIEGESIYLLEVPDNYITITSGLGDTPPRCLLLVPLKVDNEVTGVIELASIEQIPAYKVKFVEKVAESIASTLKSVKVNERTSRLLDQTKIQAEEMAAAEEEMRQNLEELQSTQEEMNRVQEEQRKVMEKNQLDNQMYDALLKSTSEFIYFKDHAGRYTRLSETAKTLLNVKTLDEAIGKTAYELFPSEAAMIIEQEDQQVMESRSPIIGMVADLTYADGSTRKVEKNKYPVFDTQGNVVGLISIYKEV